MTNAEIRRQLGGMPTGPYKLAEQRSQIVLHEEHELSAEDHEPGVWQAVLLDLDNWPRDEE